MQTIEGVSKPPYWQEGISYPPPLFSGGPLGVATPLDWEGPRKGPALWLWHRTDNLEEQSPQILDQLTAQGWREVADEMEASAIETQLYGCLRLVGEGERHLWFQPGYDLGSVDPILLCFSALSGSTWSHKSQPMLNCVPPSHYGDYALFAQTGSPSILYQVHELRSSAWDLWRRLGHAIRDLAAPLNSWINHDDNHRIVFDEPDPQQALFRVMCDWQVTYEKKDEGVRQFIEGQLRSARHQVALLQEAQRKDDWCERWETVHVLVRLLAHEYYLHHLSQQKRLTPVEGQSVPDAFATTSPETPIPVTMPVDPAASSKAEEGSGEKKQGRGKRVSPIPVVAKGRELLIFPSDLVSRALTRALRSREGFKVSQERQVAEYRATFYNQERGEFFLVLKPGKGKSVEELLDALKRKGDFYVDVFLALQIAAIDQNGTSRERIRLPIVINTDDILAICGKQKSHGSYTPMQRAEVNVCLRFLSYLQVFTSLPDRHGRGKQTKMVKSEGPLLGFSDSARDGLLEGQDNERHRVMMGSWMEVVMGQGQQTAVLLRKILAYSAKNQVYHKRLGLYLSCMFRVNARHGGSFWRAISMQALLEGADIPLPKDHPERFIQAIMQVLEDLKKDGVIGDFRLVVDLSSAEQPEAQDIRQRKHGRLDLFLVRQWNFSAPEAVLQQYQSLYKAPEAEEHS